MTAKADVFMTSGDAACELAGFAQMKTIRSFSQSVRYTFTDAIAPSKFDL
jgi:hypothetical protein